MFLRKLTHWLRGSSDAEYRKPSHRPANSLRVEQLEERANPSWLGDSWLGQSWLGNAVRGGGNAVIELPFMARDLLIVAYTDIDHLDPSRMSSDLFQAAVGTAGDRHAATAMDINLGLSLATLGTWNLAVGGQ